MSLESQQIVALVAIEQRRPIMMFRWRKALLTNKLSAEALAEALK
jgi:hypothetical protein